MTVRSFPLFMLLLVALVACGKPPRSADSPSAGEKTTPYDQQKCDLAFDQFGVCGMYKSAAPSSDQANLTFVELNNFETPVAPSAILEVYIWMPSMGHGSAPIKIQVDDTQKNVFHLSNIQFIMPGDWEIHFLLKDTNKTQELIKKIQIE